MNGYNDMYIEKYENRVEAGKILAIQLMQYAGRSDVLVLALPRGGVPVGFEVAKSLQAPLDVFIVRKLGVPGHTELAMGAIAMSDVTVFNDDIVNELGITAADIEAVVRQEQQELLRRERAYRGDTPFPIIQNKIIILVDDGIATGATMRAAIMALRKLKPSKLIVAVPVADKRICEFMLPLVDDLICPLQPNQLYAVGAWYDDFSQTEDIEVHNLLSEANTFSAEKGK